MDPTHIHCSLFLSTSNADTHIFCLKGIPNLPPKKALTPSRKWQESYQKTSPTPKRKLQQKKQKTHTYTQKKTHTHTQNKKHPKHTKHPKPRFFKRVHRTIRHSQEAIVVIVMHRHFVVACILCAVNPWVPDLWGKGKAVEKVKVEPVSVQKMMIC